MTRSSLQLKKIIPLKFQHPMSAAISEHSWPESVPRASAHGGACKLQIASCLQSMNGENRLVVTDEVVEFEK